MAQGDLQPCGYGTELEFGSHLRISLILFSSWFAAGASFGEDSWYINPCHSPRSQQTEGTSLPSLWFCAHHLIFRAAAEMLQNKNDMNNHPKQPQPW